MIYRLDGEFQTRISEDDGLLVQVGNVGYEVACVDADHFLAKKTGTIWIYTMMRDSSICLYGFRSLAERKFFAELISINGVGGKMALALLRTHSIAVLLSAANTNSEDIYTAVSGIGTKIARKIILELKHRYKQLQARFAHEFHEHSNHAEVFSVLTNMGFAERQVRAVLASLQVRDDTSTIDVVRLALPRLTRSSSRSASL